MPLARFPMTAGNRKHKVEIAQDMRQRVSLRGDVLDFGSPWTLPKAG